MLTQAEIIERDLDVHGLKSMPSTKVRAFKEEFPWIEKHSEGPILQVYVSAIELSLLSYFPEREADGGLFGINMLYEKILLLDERGEIVVKETKEYRKKFLFFGPVVSKAKRLRGIVSPSSSVGSVIEQLKESADLVRYIISYYEYTCAVIIYKLPKGVSLRQLVERENKEERAMIQEEKRKIKVEEDSIS